MLRGAVAEEECMARVEEVMGPGYARVEALVADGGRSVSSAGREVQQPWTERRRRQRDL